MFLYFSSEFMWSLQWRHNERNGISNHQRLDFCSTVCYGADQRKHRSSATLAFVGGTAGDRWIPITKGQWRGWCSHLMTTHDNWSSANKDTVKDMVKIMVLQECGLVTSYGYIDMVHTGSGNALIHDGTNVDFSFVWHCGIQQRAEFSTALTIILCHGFEK